MTNRLSLILRKFAEDERGGYSLLWILGFLPVFLIATGLIVDGAGQIQATERAQHIASGAARAGTSALSGSLNTPTSLSMNAAAAQAAANSYLNAAGMNGSVSVFQNVITVSTSSSYDTLFLQLIPGFGTLPANGQASAQLIDEG